MRKIRPFWMDAAIRVLETFSAKQSSVEGLRDDLRELEYASVAIRSARTDATPVSGGGSRREDAVLNSIVKRELLEGNLRKVSQEVKRVSDALASLSRQDRMILERFYIHKEDGAADRLAGDLCTDVKSVYAKKDQALYQFTVAMYGTVEL